MRKDFRNVQSVRTRHTIFTLRTRNQIGMEHQIGNRLERLLLFIGKRSQRLEGADVILQMLHIGHTAQNGQDDRLGTCKAESP